MSEIENLGGVLREARSAVRDDESIAPVVDGLVARVPSATGAGLDLDAALARMAQSVPPPDLAYERVPVLAALLKARPERFGRDGRERGRLVSALRPVTPDGSRRSAERMHTLLSEGVARSEDAQEMRCSLIRTGLAERSLAVVISGRTATVLSETGDAVRARMVRTATVCGVRRKDLDPLLEPEMWGSLSDHRITLSPRDEGELTVVGDKTIEYMEYLETFRVSDRFELKPRLRFARPRKEDLHPAGPDWLEYRLADEQDAGQIVTVDQGSIVVHETRDGVRVETTKRVRLTPPFDAPSLALQAEVIGYPAAFEQMVREAVHVAAGQAA